MLELLAVIVLSYVTGSFPTSILAGKIFKGIDIREHGSGNAGATNVLRVMGWKLGVLVMIVDIGKGVIATLFIARLAADAGLMSFSLVQIIAGTAAVIGHMFTIFANFRGGKGVGTGAGMLLALYPFPALVCVVLFFLIAFTTRYVSIASLSAAFALPFVLLLYGHITNTVIETPLLIFTVAVVLLIIFAHRSNIKRLLNGTENRFGSANKES